MGEPEIVGPTSHSFVSQRLRLHYVDWGNEDRPLLLLLHGGRDHARSWDAVARALRGEWRVIAPDLRGHGDSQWAVGGSYAINDFVLDLAQLLDALDAYPVTVVAHSLGGAVALQYAGVYPDRVRKLVAIEGLGPPPEMIRERLERPVWERMQAWVDQMRSLARRHPRHYPSLDAAARRMLEANPFLSEEQAHHLTVHGVSRNEDGTWTWKFDNYVRAVAPQRFDAEEIRALWGRIRCPVLLLRGTESGARDPSADGRLQAFRRARLVNVEGAGHWVHHDRLEVFLRTTREFLAEPDPVGEADQEG